MKPFVFAFLFAFSTSAVALAQDACTDFVKCGTYEGGGNWYDTDGKADGAYSEKIELKQVDATTVNIKVYVFEGLPTQPWADANTVFAPSGKFDMTSTDSGINFGTGFCTHQACTISFAPVAINDIKSPFVNTFVNILRFDGKTLKRFNMVVDGLADSERHTQVSTLTLQ